MIQSHAILTKQAILLSMRYVQSFFNNLLIIMFVREVILRN